MNIKAVTLGALLCGSWLVVQGQEPDNTKTNKDNQPTADKQGMNTSDRELTQKIRSSIMADKSLSTYAHNVKVIAKSGTVTIKGPVRSDDEKKAVVAKAVEVAGSADKVIDQVTVKP